MAKRTFVPDQQKTPQEGHTHKTKSGLSEKDLFVPTASQWPEEKGGPKGLEPTRFGDWEKDGRCSDF